MNLTLGELKYICAKATVDGIKDDACIYMDCDKTETIVDEKDFNKAKPIDDLDIDNGVKIVKSNKSEVTFQGFKNMKYIEQKETIILNFKKVFS